MLYCCEIANSYRVSLGQSAQSTICTQFQETYGKIVGFHMGNQACIAVCDYDLYLELSNKDEFLSRPGRIKSSFFY